MRKWGTKHVSNTTFQLYRFNKEIDTDDYASSDINFSVILV